MRSSFPASGSGQRALIGKPAEFRAFESWHAGCIVEGFRGRSMLQSLFRAIARFNRLGPATQAGAEDVLTIEERDLLSALDHLRPETNLTLALRPPVEAQEPDISHRSSFEVADGKMDPRHILALAAQRSSARTPAILSSSVEDAPCLRVEIRVGGVMMAHVYNSGLAELAGSSQHLADALRAKWPACRPGPQLADQVIERIAALIDRYDVSINWAPTAITQDLWDAGQGNCPKTSTVPEPMGHG